MILNKLGKSERIASLSMNNNQEPEQMVAFSEMAQAMTGYITQKNQTLATLVKLFIKVKTNCFGLTCTYFGHCGVCITLKSSLINHSCIPNATIYFIKNHAQVRVFKNVEAGEEILISYANEMDRHRNKVLKNDYGFECDCSRCVSSTHLTTLKCINSRCSAFILKNDKENCLECGYSKNKVLDEEKSIAKFINQLDTDSSSCTETPYFKPLTNLVTTASIQNNLSRFLKIASIDNEMIKILLDTLIER